MNTPTESEKRLSRVAIVALFLAAVSVIGYMWIEKLSLIDALYMMAITFSTVGFGEVRNFSPAGRLFAVFVIFSGVGVAAYMFSTMAEYMAAGEFATRLRRRRQAQILKRMKNHYIICGFGRVGQQVAIEMKNLNLPFVVIERSNEAAARCEQQGTPVIFGDATEDETLKQAGIQQARGLLAVLDNDADNIFVTLSARSLSRELLIVARATNAGAERKLLKAGANHVVSPYSMAGFHMINLLLRPNAIAFLESTIQSHNPELWLEEIHILPDSPLIGQTLGEANLRSRTGANVLTIIGNRKHKIFDWSPDFRMESGDILVVLGRSQHLDALAQLAGDSAYLQRSRLR